jgi:hypothetical protein
LVQDYIARRTSRNVKHWQSGEMALRWTAAGMLEAERQFRRVTGYRDLAKLALTIERQPCPHSRDAPEQGDPLPRVTARPSS